MARAVARFVCAGCGAVTSKWAGRCETCGEWNTITEEAAPSGPIAAKLATAKGGKTRGLVFADLGGTAAPPPRIASGIAEFDRVLGGGLVPGSAVLLAGDPGIGKSTLLLQAAATHHNPPQAQSRPLPCSPSTSSSPRPAVWPPCS